MAESQIAKTKAVHTQQPNLTGKKTIMEDIVINPEKQAELNDAFLLSGMTGSNMRLLRLIRDGADIAAKDNSDRTALNLAAANGYFETCALILREYAKSGRDIKELIAAKDKRGNTAIHDAAVSNKPEVCALILIKYAKSGGNVKELIGVKNGSEKTAQDSIPYFDSKDIKQFFKSMEWLVDATENTFMKSFSECVA